ncbi:2Fe-2S iron-sulfur cluster-binding protein [Longispora sp. NPDC051575]|uniref:(2Fe-2S)-binding protein n=1 Tax=Longispora sp. NPDC051575 TaxID=3154943 RepID=UPI00341BAFE5
MPDTPTSTPVSGPGPTPALHQAGPAAGVPAPGGTRVPLATRTGMELPVPVTIDVDGVPVTAYPGESLASALLAAGQRAVRTTTSGVRRAPYCNMGVCFECVVTVDGVPYQRTCLVRVTAGMRVRTSVPR